jgi:hypothetical protein
VLAEHRGEGVQVEQVRLQDLDAVADPVEVRIRTDELRDDADDVVAAVEQELGEVRAVLTADARDERLQWRPRT